MSKRTSDRAAHIRTYLQKKSKSELVNLLLELIQGMDEPTRQRFWEYLAPPGMAIADLRYPSPEDFLAELEEFNQEVTEGEHFDEDAATYFGEDSYYDDEDEYDPDTHKGLQALRVYFHETGTYFDAGRYDIAAQGYKILLEIVLDEPEETLGLSSPLQYLEYSEHTLVDHYFQALQESQSSGAFYQEALRFLSCYDASGRRHLERFLTWVGPQARPELQQHLEAWADEHARLDFHTPMHGLPLQLRLLLRFYQEMNRSDDCQSLWVRFRRLYPACYLPLLKALEQSGDWQTILEYGQEALKIAETPPPTYILHYEWPFPDQLTLRRYLARAFAALGQSVRALEIYQPVLESALRFEIYAEARQLADAISIERGRAFTNQIIEQLRRHGAQQRYLLCQIYLSEQRFNEAYHQIDDLKGYIGMDEVKLVAKAHLIAALGPQSNERMGVHLRDLYDKIEHSEKDATQFLRQVRSLPPDLSRAEALERAETIYRRLMQTHIDNGRKTYATAAYYCALLGEIAIHEGRLPAFASWYTDFMESYRRFRALRAEMETKVGPVLRSRPKTK
ncbi:MAG: hypothetical protein AB1894_25495 [Chloroflexota bacterium]